MGLVNAVVPLDAPRGGDGRLVPGDARAVAVRAAAAQGELQRRRGRARGDPAARPRRQPPLLHERGGGRGPRTPTWRSARPTSRSSRGGPDGRATAAAAARRQSRAGVRIWLMAARLRTLPAAVAPVLVGTALAGYVGAFHPLRVRRGAARRDLHPGRHQPLQRLLRRPSRRRHRGPARPGARHRRRARAAPPGAGRHLRLVRPRGPRRRLPDRRSPAGSCCSSAPRRSSPASLYTGGPRPYGYEGLGEVFVFLFFGIVAVAGSFFVQVRTLDLGGVRARGPGRAAGRRRSSSSTTSATSTPTAAPASGRSPCGSAASARARCSPRWSTAAYRARARHLAVRPARRRGCCCRGCRCRSPLRARPLGRATAPTGRR